MRTVPRGRHSLPHQTTANVLKSSCHQISYRRVCWSCTDSKQGDRRDWGVSIFWSKPLCGVSGLTRRCVSFSPVSTEQMRSFMMRIIHGCRHLQLNGLWGCRHLGRPSNRFWTLTFFFKNQIPAFNYSAALTLLVTEERSQRSELPPLISVSADITE